MYGHEMESKKNSQSSKPTNHDDHTTNKNAPSSSSHQLLSKHSAIAQRPIWGTIWDNNPINSQAIQRQPLASPLGIQTKKEAVQNTTTPIQAKSNNTGLPNTLKSGIEHLSGYSMGDVRVHYHSNKPAQLQAHAYAQGLNIYLGAGQEKNLPHEAWHVVQQKQGRVKPTIQFKGGVDINDNVGLEKEADLMGARANKYPSTNRLGWSVNEHQPLRESSRICSQKVAQREVIVGEDHNEGIIVEARNTTKQLVWSIETDVSKLIAALIHHKDPSLYKPLVNYSTEIQKHIKAGTFHRVMKTAENIYYGKHRQWGAENRLIKPQKDTLANKARTKIEDLNLRNIAILLRRISSIREIPDRKLNDKSVINWMTVTPETTSYEVLDELDPNLFHFIESYLSSQGKRSKGLAKSDTGAFLKEAMSKTGKLQQVPLDNAKQDEDKVVGDPSLSQEMAKRLIEVIEKIFTEVLNTATKEMSQYIDTPELSKLVETTSNVADKYVEQVTRAKYGGADGLWSRMHAVSSITRSVTQLEGIHHYSTEHNNGVNNNLGFILGYRHLVDINIFLQNCSKGLTKESGRLGRLLFANRESYEDVNAFREASKATSKAIGIGEDTKHSAAISLTAQ